MITIFTRTNNIFSKEYLSFAMNRFLKRKRGPYSVLDSLVRGLDEIGAPYQLNPSSNKVTENVHVLSGVQAMKDCISLKKKGLIKVLTAGPNLVLTPYEENSLYLSSEIDTILFPSQWPKDYFISLEKTFETKINVWPAGVKDPGEPAAPAKTKAPHVLLYLKQCPDIIKQTIINELNRLGISYSILGYGAHSQEHFFTLLENVSGMIYMSNSESQGLALLEAWARDIPTLVWDRGYWEYGQYRFEAPGMGAPYLTPECGLFFKSEADFTTKFAQFLEQRFTYRPREYYLSRFTDSKIARNFLDLIKK